MLNMSLVRYSEDMVMASTHPHKHIGAQDQFNKQAKTVNVCQPEERDEHACVQGVLVCVHAAFVHVHKCERPRGDKGIVARKTA